MGNRTNIVSVSILLIITVQSILPQVVYDLRNGDEKAVINAINGLGATDDQIAMGNPPIISGDFNNNGIPDYLTAAHAADLFYVFFDMVDFSSAMYYPHEGPNLIITGALHLGSSYAKGDFNGDGIDDILVGAKSEGGDGEAFVIYGRATLPTTGTSNINSICNVRLKFAGFSGNADIFGDQVCAADINADGYDDIIVGASAVWFQGNGDGLGSIYVVYGSTTLPSIVNTRTEADIIIEGNGLFDHIGKYIKSGDLNHDGIEDIVFTSAYWPGYGYNGQRGKAWILFGATNLPSYFNVSQSSSFITGIAGKNQNDLMAFACVGDINGDNKDDLILGAGKSDASIVFPSGNNFGRVYINYGPIPEGIHYDDVESYPHQTKINPHPLNIGIDSTYMYIDSYFGQSISVFDINLDGCDDILIGAPGYSRWPSTGSQTDEGGAFIYLGATNLGSEIFQNSQVAIFLAEFNPPMNNISFGRALSFITIANSIHAAICDVSRSLIYLFELGFTQSIVNINAEYLNIEIFPNPTPDKLTVLIETRQTASIEINIYNGLGKIVKTIEKQTYPVGKKFVPICLSDMESGIYLVIVNTNSYIITQKLIIQKRI